MRRFRAGQTYTPQEAPPPLLEISSWCRFAESREPQSNAGGPEQNPIARRRRADAACSTTPQPSRLGARASHRAPEPEKARRAAVAQRPKRVIREREQYNATIAPFHASPLRWLDGAVASRYPPRHPHPRLRPPLADVATHWICPRLVGHPAGSISPSFRPIYGAKRAAVETDEYRIQSN